MCFFDSDVCIEIMRGHLPRAQEIMRKSSPDLFGVPAIVEAELLYGAEPPKSSGRWCLRTC